MKAEILSKSQQKEFDRPPKFSLVERRMVFEIPDSLRGSLRKLESPTSIVGFTLQYGYFKTSGKFFYVDTFNSEDIEVICKWNKFNINDINWSSYRSVTFYHHQKAILKYFGILPFGKKEKQQLFSEATRLLKKQKRPDILFWILAEYLRSHKIEVPTYYALSSLIQQSVKQLNRHYSETIRDLITKPVKGLLDGLLEKEEESFIYTLTKLKNANETARLRDIRENMKAYLYFKNLFFQIQNLALQLDLSMETIEYHAQFVIKARIFQISRRENKYLMLLCFIMYQYYFLGDLLMETLISTSKAVENSARNVAQTILLENQSTIEQDLEHILTSSEDMAIHITELLKVREDDTMKISEKIRYYEQFVFSRQVSDFVEIIEPIGRIRKKEIRKEPIFYKALEEHSHKLQKRVSQLIRNLDFEISIPILQEANQEFKKEAGNISEAFCSKFLTKDEKKNVKNAKSLPALYKILFTRHLVKGIKSGEVSLVHSFQHRPFEHYLIRENWEQNRYDILKDVGLSEKVSWKQVESELLFSLQESFYKTYDSINNPENHYVKAGRKGNRPRFETPSASKAEKQIKEQAKSTFPPENSIPLLEVLNTVNQRVGFTKSFIHWSNRSIPKKPSDMELFAVVMAYGCNIGLDNMAKNTTNINANALDTIANWYCSLENIRKANDRVVEYTEKLKLVELLKKEQQKVHTSSDGQKFYIKTDSIHANYSFKYFGKDKGIVMYSFIDNLHRQFYATAFSAGERESTYVIDGLLHNEIIETEIHSTDTHGYTELVFAITYFLGIDFAPRIAKFEDHQLFSMEGIIVPDLEQYDFNVKEINPKNIEKQWDKILHIVATLKLRHTPASILFKRLSSYSRQNPVYLALRDFGRLVRTKFLLEYMYDHNLRKMVLQQLNKGESANKLAKRIFYGNNGEIKYVSKQEHLQATTCKTLIHNLIVCWNYMYLSKKLVQTTPENRKEFFEHIKNTSPVRWEHFNFYGIFDFSPEALKDALEFNTQDLFDFEME